MTSYLRVSRKKPLYVVIRYLFQEALFLASLRHPCHKPLDALSKLLARLAHTEAHESQRGLLVEYHNENDPLLNDRDVEVVLLALVEEYRELLLSYELRKPPGRRYVAGSEGRQRGRVNILGIPAGGDELPVLVDEVYAFRVCFPEELLDYRRNLFVFLLEHHE